MKIEVEIENGTIEIEDGVIVQISGEMYLTAMRVNETTVTAPVAETVADSSTALGAVVDGKFVAAPVPKHETDWAEGLAHFRQRWEDGYAGARDPGAVLRWKAMLWVLSQFDEVARTDEVILPLIEDIRAASLVQLQALSTPENITEQQAVMAALDTLKLKIPDMFPAKGVKVE